jgi:hypothetical protein
MGVGPSQDAPSAQPGQVVRIANPSPLGQQLGERRTLREAPQAFAESAIERSPVLSQAAGNGTGRLPRLRPGALMVSIRPGQDLGHGQSRTEALVNLLDGLAGRQVANGFAHAEALPTACEDQHATPLRDLPSIQRKGLLCSKRQGKLKVVWLHAPAETSWAVLHTVRRHGGRVEGVINFEVEVPRSWLRRSRKGLWYCPHDIPPDRFGRLVTFTELEGPSVDDQSPETQRPAVRLAC